MYSNSEILAAVLAKWSEPLMALVLNGKMDKIPFIGNIQSKIRATGWVSPEWCIANELAPFAGSIISPMVVPVLKGYIGDLPEESIPQLAHSVVDKAIEHGSLTIMEGNIKFNKEDLMNLKRLLNANLPYAVSAGYKVKEEVV